MEPLVGINLPHDEQSPGFRQHRLGAPALARHDGRGGPRLVDARGQCAGRVPSASARTGAIGHSPVACRRAKSAGNVRPAAGRARFQPVRGRFARRRPGVQLAAGFERVAEEMENMSLVRSLVSKEGDHERGTYLVKTGYRPDPTLVHPSIGAICCHQLPVGPVEIPRHVSILPDQWPSRGGFLGNQFDAFKTLDPSKRVPDVTGQVSADRQQARVRDLEIIDAAFRPGRDRAVAGTLHGAMIEQALAMMGSRAIAAHSKPSTSRRPCAPPMATRPLAAAAWPRGG